MNRGAAGWITFILSAILALVFLVTALVGRVQARDLGQWENSDPTIREWYKSLMQPDSPTVPCCGEADAYWCDDVHVREGTDGKPHTFCKITDDREDAPLGRPHRNVGEEFEIPDNKLKWDRGNPVGHEILFVNSSGIVLCFVQGTRT